MIWMALTMATLLLTARSEPFNITLFGKFNLSIEVTANAVSGKPQVVYQVDMPSDSFLGLVYGSSMTNTDMVAFVANT